MTEESKAFASLLRDIRGLLAYHQASGISHYQRSPALDRFINCQPRPPTVPVQPDVTGLEKDGEFTQSSTPPCLPLTDLYTSIGACSRCRLHASRQRVVLGRGRGTAPLLLLIGDFPAGEDERCGEAFSGPAGELLIKMLAAIKLDNDHVYTTNLLKCRPPDHQPPAPDEIASCLPYLLQEIEATAPRIICAMGPLATRMLLKTEESFFRLRGRFFYLSSLRGAKIVVMPTFHPDFLLKNPEMKKASWQDLQLIAKKLAKGG